LLNLDGQALDALQKFKCVGIRRELDRVCLWLVPRGGVVRERTFFFCLFFVSMIMNR
jgi:hypothetical protein